VIKLLQKEYFARTLPGLVSDASDSLGRILKRGEDEKTDIIDPFDDMYKIVYKLTMRTVGASEITNDPKLLDTTLSLFQEIGHGSSPLRIMFPWLPTVGRVRQTIAGVRMFLTFGKIVRARKAGERQEDDALQYLVETGADTTSIVAVSRLP
jgi:cytochrome P450